MLILLPLPAMSDWIVEETDKLEGGGGLLTRAFMIVWRGMESIERAFLRCDKRLSIFLSISRGGGLVADRPEKLGGEAVDGVVCGIASLPGRVE